MKTLLILDDLTELSASKNRWLQFFLKRYIIHAQSQINLILNCNIQNESIFIAGPKKIVESLRTPASKLFYEERIELISYERAGEIASSMAQRWQNSESLRRACPQLFDFDTSVPKIAYARLSFLYGHDPLDHFMMIEDMVNEFKIERMLTLTTSSPIERTALALAKRKNIKFAVSFKNDLVSAVKKSLMEFLYRRDRRTHAMNFLRADSQEPVLPKKAGNKKLICLQPGHTLHFRLILPLAKAINATSDYSACVLMHSDFKSLIPELKNAGIEYLLLEQFGDRKTCLKMFKSHLKELADAWKRSLRGGEFSKEHVADGIDWFCVLKHQIEWFFKYSFSEILVLRERIKLAIKFLKPSACFVFSDSRFFETTGAAIARGHKIPVFLYSPNIIHGRDNINLYDTGDYTLFVNTHMRDYVLGQKSVQPSRALVVGDIRFDNDAKIDESQKQKIYDLIKIPPQKHIFTLISFYLNLRTTKSDKMSLFKMARDSAARRDDVALVVKAHPNENEECLYQELKELDMSHVPIVKLRPSFYSLLSISTGIITLGSAASLESLALGTPVILALLPGRNFDYYIPLRESGKVPTARSSDELLNVMSQLIDNTQYAERCSKDGKNFISPYLSVDQGKSSVRVLEIVREVLDANIKIS